MVNLDLADEHVYPERDVILEERRSRVDNEPVGPAGRAADGGAVSAPSLPAAGDRLVPRDRGLHPRGRGRLLSPVVRAQQRDPGRGRRRHRGRAAAAGRAHLRPDPGPPGAATPPAGRAAPACRAAGRAAPRAGAPAEPDALLPGPQLQLGRAASTPMRWRCWPRSWAAAAPAGCSAAVVVEQGLAAGAGAYYHGTSLDASTFRVYASPRPGVDMAELERAVDARDRPHAGGRRHRGRAHAHPAAPAGRGHLSPATRWAVPPACSAWL